uniref:FAR1 domain-containing protein n=1 Tax=Cajanus cajan TaxID=3821 RepID=A0A151T9V1_CAJCA|nr:hypothetical protein KK1_018415 [Cajanus cajan]
MRQFLCNKGGLRDKKHLMRDDRKKGHRPLSRTNCKAKLRVRLDPKTSKWKVVSFEEGHNHDYKKNVNFRRNISDGYGSVKNFRWIYISVRNF